MKATGIVRRIDDLGRIVVPKEIRRTLRIREGDALEIFTDREGEIIFKKYSPLGEMGNFAGATPLFHSDRGYQYTSKAFRRRILAAGMTQSMSRVARCIDNGPMEGFWGLMKREMYYGKKYKTKEELMLAIEKYIDYYTNKRVQRNLGVLTPLEFHEQKLENVA